MLVLHIPPFWYGPLVQNTICLINVGYVTDSFLELPFGELSFLLRFTSIPQTAVIRPGYGRMHPNFTWMSLNIEGVYLLNEDGS